ncbi:Por secretion system C-terminal sorting domain-containing protein [Tangfeifania diversioriginum]|uniref:Por secretion system C-terminal sorting domain-containing protein n=1 Tax=Tangfeifania diversioriginum TaxID=1168035 RepID=A0A1M6KVQ0_9BACT|nr:T9SS type A sorting domain-containing protein [Tangfeifania diversioriginum]SHJ62950.1 Por secretion system C-terminal sorting domain-containing protein [Tangfeifania diversioriginum]
MKRLLIFNLIFLIGPVILLAQPTITNMLNLETGDKYWRNIIETEEEIVPAEGLNLTWDYSNTTGILIGGDPGVCVAPSETPFADSAAVLASNFAVMTYDPEETGGVKVYDFGIVENNRVVNLAIALTNASAVTYSKYVNPDTVLLLPFSYGNEFDSSSEIWGATNKTSPYEYKDVAVKKTKAVGYGTVKTPAGVFENALMVKSDITSSMFYNDGTLGGQNLKTTEYVWYVPGIKISVLSVFIFDEEVGGTISYTAKTEFASGGIDDGGNGNGGDDNGDDDNGGNGDDDEEPYDPAGGWLNVCGSAGEYFGKSTGSLSWTVGEAVIETLEGASHFFTQGFGQPEERITAAEVLKKGDKTLVYPNPFKAKLNIHIEDFSESVFGTVYSKTGQAIKNFKLNDPVSELHLNDLKPGMYFIRLIKDNPETFIVVKQ